MSRATISVRLMMGVVVAASLLWTPGWAQAAPVGPDTVVHLTIHLPDPLPPALFDTEMLSLDLMAGPFMLRESPTRASLGQTRIIDTGGGHYAIDSFFDIFTELSLDGGLSWTPSRSPLPGLSPGTIPIEMLALNLVGGPLRIRESPTLPSLGQMKFTDVGGGEFRIDSFFDVFTELSLDGGQTWSQPMNGRLTGSTIPLPPAMWAGGLALAGIVLKKRHARML